jgi:hypothetical protein
LSGADRNGQGVGRVIAGNGLRELEEPLDEAANLLFVGLAVSGNG